MAMINITAVADGTMISRDRSVSSIASVNADMGLGGDSQGVGSPSQPARGVHQQVEVRRSDILVEVVGHLRAGEQDQPRLLLGRLARTSRGSAMGDRHADLYRPRFVNRFVEGRAGVLQVGLGPGIPTGSQDHRGNQAAIHRFSRSPIASRVAQDMNRRGTVEDHIAIGIHRGRDRMRRCLSRRRIDDMPSPLIVEAWIDDDSRCDLEIVRLKERIEARGRAALPTRRRTGPPRSA